MARSRRKSNLRSDIHGDTNSPAVSTTPVTPAARQASRDRQSILSSKHKRHHALTYYTRWREISFKYTWVNPLLVTSVVLSLYALNPTESNPLHPALFLSYPIPAQLGVSNVPTQYGKGPKDFAFVAFYTVVLSFFREFLMQQVIRPYARSRGIRTKAKLARFMEQAYSAIYFGIAGAFGLYVMRRSPVWYFNTTAMFEGFPHRSHEWLFKLYYLLEASYWMQQALVMLLQLEKPRADFKELVAHHIITLSLIWLSYRFHFTYIGIAIYVTHDISDFFFSTSKVLNYLDSPIVTPYFVVFITSWIYLRHVMNLKVLWAILTEFRTVGPFELNWETEQYKCWISQYITFALLAGLQSLNLFWLFLIFRVLKRILVENVRKDDRSDDEDEEEEDSENDSSESSGSENKLLQKDHIHLSTATSVLKPDRHSSEAISIVDGRKTRSKR